MVDIECYCPNCGKRNFVIIPVDRPARGQPLSNKMVRYKACSFCRQGFKVTVTTKKVKGIERFLEKQAGRLPKPITVTSKGLTSKEATPTKMSKAEDELPESGMSGGGLLLA